jgi:hypothetical protein
MWDNACHMLVPTKRKFRNFTEFYPGAYHNLAVNEEGEIWGGEGTWFHRID